MGVLQTFIHIESKGKKLAKKAMNNVTALPFMTIKEQDKEIIRHLLKCGSSLCVVIDEKKNVSLVEPKNVILMGRNFKDK
jgi:hypothetical protein